MRQAIVWTNTDPIHRRMYVTLGGDELSMSGESQTNIGKMCQFLTTTYHDNKEIVGIIPISLIVMFIVCYNNLYAI